MGLDDTFVDLDIYAASGGTCYRLSDIRGREREIDVPADLPFPLALGLVRCYDSLIEAITEETEEQEARRRFRRLCQVLAAIGSLVSQGPSAAELVSGFGQERVVVFANVLIARIHAAQQGMNIEAWLARLVKEGEAGPKAPEQAEKASPSAASSASSADETGGHTTTGAGSDGPSSSATSETSQAAP